MQWNITDDLVLRGAVFRFVKPALANNQTLEPTQVAGFNQLFDDTNGTAAWRYGVGLDHRLMGNLFIGTEATWRELSNPILRFRGPEQAARELGRADASGVCALAADPGSGAQRRVRLRQVRGREGENLTDAVGVPEKAVTYSVPFGARYFHPSGFFAGAGVTYVNQDVNRDDLSGAGGLR